MKKISILIFVFVFTTIASAQQFPLQSQYQFNYSTINPAVSGENSFYRVRASFREQWKGFIESPISTQILTVTKGFQNNGLGLTVFSDQTGGAFNKSGASISFSHKVKFEESDLYFGVSAGLSKINLGLIEDPAILLTEGTIPEFNFGVYYKFKDINLGFSIPGLLNSDMKLTGSLNNTIDRHYYTMISYRKQLNDDWSMYPSMLIRNTDNHQQIDANINFKLRNKLWFGTSYRQDFGPTIYVGIDFGRLLSVYSIDISTNEVANYSHGSHEFTLGYDFISESEVVINEDKKEDEEVINDKDKDGIIDEYDLCPNEFGDELANGCPDFDKDGIPDKYDLCPHLFGDESMQGCPALTTNESVIISTALQDLNFDFDRSVINSQSFSSLTNLAVLMHKNPKMILFLEGHASSEGEASYNLSLSAKRAKSVQEFFTGRGITKERLIIDFHGEESPLNSNENEQERAKNRRVEFKVKYHLFDRLSANSLKAEYDSLLNTIYSNITPLSGSMEQIKNENNNEVSSDSISFNKIDTLLISDQIDNTFEVDSVAIDTDQLFEVDYLDTINNTQLDTNNNSKQEIKPAFFLIVQVFTVLDNAISYVANSTENLKYIFLNDSYYVYVFSTDDRKEIESFRDEYKSSCWILDIR